MKKLILALGLIALAGCSSNASKEKIAAQERIANKQIEQKTLTFSCTVCENLIIEFNDPRREVNIPKDTNGWDFANNLVNKATGIAPWIAVSNIAVQGMKSAGDNVSGSNNSDSSYTGDVIDDSSSHITDSYNATSTPTVVNQPEPVVVAPTVITP